MDDTQKMLRIIINGQNSLKQEFSARIDKLDEKLNGLSNGLNGKIDKLDKKLTTKLDEISKQLDSIILNRQLFLPDLKQDR